MGRPKMENPASRLAAINKRRAGLFKKAHELAVLCDAEVAVINISSEGRVYKFSSSSVEDIVARYRNCSESGYRHELQPKPEEPEELVAYMEVDVSKQEAEERESRQLYNLLHKDLKKMNLHEIFVLKDKIFKGMMFMRNTKEKLLIKTIEESKMEKEKLLQNNQSLRSQVVALEAFVAPPIYYPVPISVHIPPMARDAGFYPWANFAAPMLAITSGRETEGNFQYADKTSSLPSTSFATNNDRHFINGKDSIPFMSFGAAPVANNEKSMNTLQPSLHWLRHGDTGAEDESMIVPSSQGKQ